MAARPGTLWTRFNRGRDAIGQTYFRAPNPEDGAYLDYRIPAGAAATIEIFNASGERLRTLPAPAAGAGISQARVVWDMRGEPTAAQGAGRAGGAGRGSGAGGRGPLVPPGVYEARLLAGGQVATARLEVRADPGR